MHPEHRAEAAPRKPTHQQFPESRVDRLTADETANIAGPPRDARHAHAQACLKLFSHGTERRIDVSRPRQHGVLLAARPRAADQAHDVFFSRFLQSLIEPLGITDGVHVGALQRRARVITVIIKIVISVFRFRFIQPEAADALLIIVFFALLPDEFLRVGMGRVKISGIAHPCAVQAAPMVGSHQIAVFGHEGIIAAAFIHRRPYGHHRFHAHIVQFLHHGVRVGPVPGFKAEVALQRPMEKVDHDGIQRQAPALMLPGHVQQFLLRAVAQLALPVAKAVFRHHGRAARRQRILGFDLGGRISGGDEVVQLHGAFGVPFRHVGGESHGADGGIVPQKAIAPAGHEKRHAGLTVAVRQFQRRALFVQLAVLILTHAENFFIVIGLEPGGQFHLVGAHDGLEFPALQIQRKRVPVEPVPIAPELGGQFFALLIQEAEPAFRVQFRGDLSVPQPGIGALLVVLGVFFSAIPRVGGIHGLIGDLRIGFPYRLHQGPIVAVHLRESGHPHPQGIFAPWFDPELAVSFPKDQSFPLVCYLHFSSSQGFALHPRSRSSRPAIPCCRRVKRTGFPLTYIRVFLDNQPRRALGKQIFPSFAHKRCAGMGAPHPGTISRYYSCTTTV